MQRDNPNFQRYPYFISHCTFTQVRLHNPDIEARYQDYLQWYRPRFNEIAMCFGGGRDCKDQQVCNDVEYVKQNCGLLKNQQEQLSNYTKSPAYLEYARKYVEEHPPQE